MDSIRVGTTLHFAVIQEPMLSNVVYRTKQCSVPDKKLNKYLKSNEIKSTLFNLYFGLILKTIAMKIIYNNLNPDSVFNSNRQIEFILFDAERDAFDPHVATTRLKFWFLKVSIILN